MALYGREEQEWDLLVRAGREFLVERARQRQITTYTDLNKAIATQTGVRGFDFSSQAERTAMGHLLYSIVMEDFHDTKLMLSALVQYIDANEAGPGFYELAAELELLPRKASRRAKEEFWVKHVSKIYDYYSSKH